MAESREQQEGREESGEERQERIQREQHRPEQDRGYDEAVQRPDVPDSRDVPADKRPSRAL